MKVFIPLLCLAAVVIAEPPVGDGYPDARSHNHHDHHGHNHELDQHDHQTADHQRSLSQEYGPPTARDASFNGYEYDAPNARNAVNAGQSRFPPATVRVSYNQRFTSAAARKSDHTSRSNQEHQANPHSGISQKYGAPAESPTGEYGAPSARSPSQEYSAPSARSLSQEYGAPAKSPSQEYGTPTARSPSQKYGAPSTRSPSEEYGVPASRSLSQKYGTPAKSPSQEYGTPASRSPSQEYGTPSIASARNPSTEYGAPNVRSTPSEQYGAPVDARNQPTFNIRDSSNSLSEEYNVPASRSQSDSHSHGYYASARSNEISEGYEHKPTFSSRTAPSQSYGAPSHSLSNSHSAASTRNSNSQGYDSVSHKYGAPSQKELSESFGAPNARSLSQEYGVPASRSSQTDAVASYPAARSTPSSTYLPSARGAMPSPQYGVPDQDDNARARALNELLNQEPASYDFGYQIEDQESGSDFGHSETREENRAEGSYFVVLPDGTKQTVEYEADERGFRPRISMEPADASARSGGYDDNAQDLARSAGPY